MHKNRIMTFCVWQLECHILGLNGLVVDLDYSIKVIQPI